MKFSLALCCAAVLSTVNIFAADETPAPQVKPGIWNRITHPFGGGKQTAATPATSVEKKPGIVSRVLHPFGGGKGSAGRSTGGLTAALTLAPLPLKLSATNRLKVTLTLANRGKKLVPLEFPTSQRIEVLIKNGAGKTIEQWSQDQAFTNEPTLMTINPSERVEYTVEVATRELTAGQSYRVEGFFPSHDKLRAEQTLVPVK